jgi:tRNA(Arg) A34 adenosine deaminase TadA
MTPEQLMRQAIARSRQNIDDNIGGPFAALVVREGEIIATGTNRVTSDNDPTAHAEMVAIRRACAKLGRFHLHGCDLYTSCEPCPMCLGAIYWAHLDRIYYANTRDDAAQIGFDDALIYKELNAPLDNRQIPTVQLLAEEAISVFEAWEAKVDKIRY